MFESFLKGIFYILYSIVLLIITPIRNYIYNPIVNRLDLIGGNRDNGIITIKPEKITYKHGDTEEIEIESQDREKEGHRSIQLPREIIQTLFDGDEMGALSFKYLVKEKVFMQSNNDIGGGVLLTGKFANFKIGEDFCTWISKNRNNLNINSLPIKPVININSNFNQRNSVFAAIGVEADDALIENHGSMNIRTDYILFIANRIYSRNGGAVGDSGKNGISSDILDLDADFVIITDNLINSATSFAHLIRNSKKIKIGKMGAKIVNISNNNVRGLTNTNLINSDTILEVNGKDIYMTDNDISSTGVGVYLLKNSGETTIGAPNTRIVNISNNRVNGRFITSLVGVDSKSVLTVNGNSIYVMANLACCIMENRGKVNINLCGANSRFELSGNRRVLENDEGLGGIVMFDGSQFNFINHFSTMATIIIGDNIWSYGDDTILTFEGVGSNEKNFAKIKKNSGLDKSSVSVGGEENTFLRIPIAIGSGTGGTFLIQNPDIQTNNNDNYTFGDTNNNNNENEKDNEYENDLFFVKLKKSIKVSKIEIKANTTVSMEDGGKFERVKRGSTLDIPEGKRLTVRSDGSCNSIRDCISGFTMSDETISRIRFYRQEMDYDED